MGYRIYITKVKKESFLEEINKVDKYWDWYEKFDRGLELFNELDIYQFTPIEKFKDEEYVPFILNKDDLQKIIHVYRDIIIDDYKDKDKKMTMVRMFIHSYFETLKKRNVNIESSSLYIFDYFYLVRMLENCKNDECFVITHG